MAKIKEIELLSLRDPSSAAFLGLSGLCSVWGCARVFTRELCLDTDIGTVYVQTCEWHREHFKVGGIV